MAFTDTGSISNVSMRSIRWRSVTVTLITLAMLTACGGRADHHPASGARPGASAGQGGAEPALPPWVATAGASSPDAGGAGGIGTTPSPGAGAPNAQDGAAGATSEGGAPSGGAMGEGGALSQGGEAPLSNCDPIVFED